MAEAAAPSQAARSGKMGFPDCGESLAVKPEVNANVVPAH